MHKESLATKGTKSTNNAKVTHGHSSKKNDISSGGNLKLILLFVPFVAIPIGRRRVFGAEG